MGIETAVNLLVLVAIVVPLAGMDEEGRFRASLRRLWGGWGTERLGTFEDIVCGTAQLRQSFLFVHGRGLRSAVHAG